MSFHDYVAAAQVRKATRKATRRALRATGFVELPPWEHPQPIQVYNLQRHLRRLCALTPEHTC